ncbi:MAG TPA: SgcJ/EcaC family oxidoreductase [Candidatus Dormibacteraeota bacterium]|nr:SgcJ/EcaC family oxidoreductase [Candidatus Dormibacteraeota bacterium]
MISIRTRVALGVLLFLSFSAVSSQARQAPGTDADSAAIKHFVAGFTTNWNNHDVHAVTMQYVEDGDFSNTMGVPSHGRKELEKHYAMIFGTFLKDAHRTDTVRSIRFLTPDIASVDIDWQMTGARTRAGAELPTRKGLLTWIVTKHDGKWLITIYHESAF